MNMYTNTKKTKKFILILVLLMLFNFMCPKQVKAFDFAGNISSFFFWIERGVVGFINNIFCDEHHDFIFNGGTTRVYFTAENIMKGKFILFDANIFKDLGSYGREDRYDQFDWLVGADGAKTALRNNIAGWYYNLLNFAIVALLSVLVYVGIRMVISTISQDKAKYKMMFKDWVVAICLLVVMHYIMIGVLTVTSLITEAIGVSGGGANQTEHIMSLIYNINEGEEKDCDNETEDCRYEETIDGVTTCYTIGDAFTYELLLLAIILLTFLFAWKYLKREFTIIFLILIGPISCITYPIDKISDGKAQAFNKWLSEFIYNVLVQPFHLLIYVVLVGSAVELANNNILYGLACLAMIIPAEKFVKEMFGFKDKLGSPLGAMATGAAASQLLSKAKGGISKGSGSSGGDDKSAPRLKDKSINNDMISGGSTDSGSGTQGQIGDGESASEDSDGETVRTVGDDREELDNSDDTTALNSGSTVEDSYPDEEEPMSDEGSGNFDDNNDGQENLDANENQAIPIGDGNEESDTPKRSIKSKAAGAVKGFAGRLWDAHNQRSTEKWGSAKIGQRWINRGKKLVTKGVPTLLKGSVKAAGGLAGAAIGASVGLLSGKGIAAGAIAGASIAGRATDKVSNVVSDYSNRMQTPEQVEKKNKENFMGNKKEIQKARASFMERNNGRIPTADEFEQEMQDRYELSRFGLSDDQIDDAVGTYQELKEADNGMTDEQALNQAALASQLANRYKGKFEKESDMKGALDALTERLGGNEDKAREILGQAAAMKSETIQLPPRKIPESFATQMLKARGISKPTSQQIQQEEILQVQLQDNGFDQNDISRLNQLAANTGADFETIVDRTLSVHYEWQKGKSNDVTKFLGNSATQGEIHEETIERLEIELNTGITNQDTISDLREFELEHSKGDRNKVAEYRKLGAKVVKNGGKVSQKDKASTDKDVVALAELYSEAYKAEHKKEGSKS